MDADWLGVMAIGFFLMAGAKALIRMCLMTKIFIASRRITLAPIFIVAGFVIEIFAIMKKQK